MGYVIDLINSKFFIPAENKEAALNALFDMWLPDKDAAMSGGSFGPSGDVKWYSWMNNSADAFRNRTIKTLEEALDEWSYHPEINSHGDIVDLWFDGEKIGDENQMFKALAPFVEPGSYLDFHGEDGELWRWYFDGETMTQQFGRVVFD